jgi:hypothetical protein
MTSAMPPHVTRSSFVSLMAWLGIISGALTAVGTCFAVVTHPTLPMLVGFLSGVATLATSLGLRQRKEWARIGFIGVIAYSTLMGFVGAARIRMPELSQFGATGGIGQEQVDALMPTLRATALVGAIVVALFNVLIILKLSSRTVREEFGAEPEA